MRVVKWKPKQREREQFSTLTGLFSVLSHHQKKTWWWSWSLKQGSSLSNHNKDTIVKSSKVMLFSFPKISKLKFMGKELKFQLKSPCLVTRKEEADFWFTLTAYYVILYSFKKDKNCQVVICVVVDHLPFHFFSFTWKLNTWLNMITVDKQCSVSVFIYF